MTRKQWAMSLVTCALLVGCSPPDRELALLCPVKERLVEIDEERVRLGVPLRDYEKREMDRHLRYIADYCK
jgi:hypothetical protein